MTAADGPFQPLPFTGGNRDGRGRPPAIVVLTILCSGESR